MIDQNAVRKEAKEFIQEVDAVSGRAPERYTLILKKYAELFAPGGLSNWHERIYQRVLLEANIQRPLLHILTSGVRICST